MTETFCFLKKNNAHKFLVHIALRPPCFLSLPIKDGFAVYIHIYNQNYYLQLTYKIHTVCNFISLKFQRNHDVKKMIFPSFLLRVSNNGY